LGDNTEQDMLPSSPEEKEAARQLELH